MCSDVNWVSPEGDTPLLAACRNGHVSAALCLLDNGAEVDLAAGDGQTALHFCCQHGNEEIAEALITRGANVLARDNRGECHNDKNDEMPSAGKSCARKYYSSSLSP